MPAKPTARSSRTPDVEQAPQIRRTAGRRPGDRLFERFSDAIEWVPTVDIRESGRSYVLTAELPGVRKEDVEVTLEGNVLTLRGKRQPEEKAEEADTYQRIERSYGSFSRSFTLPSEVVADDARAGFADGVLRLEIPKPSGGSAAKRIPLDPPAVGLKQLHHPDSGRLDARRVAEYLDLPLKQLSEALGKKYSAVHKTPDARSLQPVLQPIKRSLEILEAVLGDRETVLAWWNSPHSDLGRRSPMDLLLRGQVQPIADMLEAAMTGTPS